MIVEVDFDCPADVAKITWILGKERDELAKWKRNTAGAKAFFIPRGSVDSKNHGAVLLHEIEYTDPKGKRTSHAFIKQFYASSIEIRDMILEYLCKEFDELRIEFDLTGQNAKPIHNYSQMGFVIWALPDPDEGKARCVAILKT